MGRRGARKAGPSARATHEFFGQGLPDVSAPQATTTTHDPQHPPAETPTENPCSSDPLDHPLPQIPSPDITLFAPTALSIDAKAEFIFTHLYNEGLVRLYYQYKIDKLPVLDGLLTKFSSNYRRRVPDRDTYVWHVDLEIIKQFAEAHVHEESTFFSINGAESTGVKPEDIVITVVDRVGELEVVLCIVEFFLETARKHQVQYGAPHEISLISLGLILFTYRHKRLAPNNVKHQKVWDWFYEGRKSRMDTKENLIFTSPQKIPKLKEGEVDEMSFAQLSVGDKIYEWIEETKAAQAEAKAAENINGEGAGAVNGSTADKTTQTEDGALADITNGAATAPGPANGGSGKGRRNKKKKEKKKAKGKRDTANPDVQNPSSEDVSASGVSHTVDDAAAVAPGPVNGASGKGKGKGKARDTDNAPAYNPGPDDVSAPGVAHTVNDDDDTPTLTASAGVTALPAPGVGTDPGPGPRPAHRATRSSAPDIDAGLDRSRPVTEKAAKDNLQRHLEAVLDRIADKPPHVRRAILAREHQKIMRSETIAAAKGTQKMRPTATKATEEVKQLGKSDALVASLADPGAPSGGRPGWRGQFEIGRMQGWADDLEKMQIDALRRIPKPMPKEKEEEKKDGDK